MFFCSSSDNQTKERWIVKFKCVNLIAHVSTYMLARVTFVLN